MTYRKAVHITALALAVAAFAACGSKLNNDNLTKVKNGMTRQQVVQILGEPTKVETGEIMGLQGTTFHYEKGKTKVEVNFINDSVVTKSGTFE